MKADGDTLVVPTYVLRYTEAKGDDAKYLGAAASRDKAADAATEFAVVKNAAGAYSLVAVKEVTDGKLSYEGSTGSNAKTAKIGTTDLKVSFDGGRYMPAKALNEAYANVEVLDANPFNPSLAAKPRHASFDNMLGSINYQLNKNGFNEGILSAESMIFWLDTADSKAKTPSFYISKGIEVAEGEEKPLKECSCSIRQILCIISWKVLLRNIRTRNIIWKVQASLRRRLSSARLSLRGLIQSLLP